MQKFFFGLMIVVGSSAAYAQPTELILLRHLHKNSGENPSLSPCGLAQAKLVHQALEQVNVHTAWHSQYQRTEQTARLITKNSATYHPYDAKMSPDSFITTLLAQQGVQLVVGHSNTIPELVKALSGDQVSIAETDYGTLYRLRWQHDRWQLQQQPLPRMPSICDSPLQPQQH